MPLVVSAAGKALDAVTEHVADLVNDKVASRIAAKDFTLWGKDAEAESSIRLGWVNSATDSQALVAGILALRDEFAAKGVDRSSWQCWCREFILNMSRHHALMRWLEFSNRRMSSCQFLR